MKFGEKQNQKYTLKVKVAPYHATIGIEKRVDKEQKYSFTHA